VKVSLRVVRDGPAWAFGRRDTIERWIKFDREPILHGLSE
jgi:hypothetical protein